MQMHLSSLCKNPWPGRLILFPSEPLLSPRRTVLSRPGAAISHSSLTASPHTKQTFPVAEIASLAGQPDANDVVREIPEMKLFQPKAPWFSRSAHTPSPKHIHTRVLTVFRKMDNFSVHPQKKPFHGSVHAGRNIQASHCSQPKCTKNYEKWLAHPHSFVYEVLQKDHTHQNISAFLSLSPKIILSFFLTWP